MKERVDMKYAFILLGAVAASTLAIAAVATASAKVDRNVVHVDCGPGGVFEIVANGDGGNSTFTPAHIIGTNKNLKPVAFSNVVIVVTDNEGETETFSDPDVAKTHAPTSAELMDCHFSLSLSFPDATAYVTGDAVVYIQGD